MSEKINKVRTPFFAKYSKVRSLVQILEEVPKSTVTGMFSSIYEQTGTPQNPVDWTEPDKWIPERLKGEHAKLAQKIWDESNHENNPRHIQGAYLFINSFSLLEPDSIGFYQQTDRGKAFLENDKKVISELDDLEGLIQLLSILSTKTKARFSDLVPEWGEFLLEYSKFGSMSTIKQTLRGRLGNLVERGLIVKEGTAYSITQKGMDYATTKVADDPKKKVIRALTAYNSKQMEALKEKLGKMPPKAFEKLIGDLLEAMGYEDVTVTKESGDKGVDVMATVQFGITTITEVVQVKRHQGSIGRPILDQLRGALPYHKAIRGTIITIGNFSKGCTEAALFPGAAPITLIDGKKLLELLVEHGIGVRKREATLYEVDDEFFTPELDDTQVNHEPMD